MKKTFLLLLYIFVCAIAHAHVAGEVLDIDGTPLVGASVFWANSNTGTFTDNDGKFEIEKVHTTRTLIASYVGYRNDTIEVLKSDVLLTFVLAPDVELDEVVVAQRQAALVRSRISTLNVQTLNSAELCKAACCNLSESFETSAAVDVAYADAATGAKQIRLLGLAGTYVQLLTENTPGIRGLAQSFGMEYIPGPWMDAIQVSKGTSSVVNGYESTTGQINVEYLKPSTQDPIAINLMLNSELHSEVNLMGGWLLTPSRTDNPDGTEVSTGVLAHAQLAPINMDMNGDGFVDMPSGWNVNLLNRWDIFHGNYTGRILVRGLYDKRLGGNRINNIFSTAAYPTEAPTPYLIDLDTRRVEGFMKNGFVLDDDRNMSIGIITAGSYHWQKNQYGIRLWNAAQANAYLNAMFQTNFGDEHKLTTGLSLNHDTYKETADLYSLGVNGGLDGIDIDMSRRQTDIGVFAEYDFKPNDIFSLLVGLRGDVVIKQAIPSSYSLLAYYRLENDQPNITFLPTPRLNMRFAPWEWWVIRASIGLGYRSPNVLADNASYLPSSRQFYLGGNIAVHSLPMMETAFNTGLTSTFYIPIGQKELQLTAEYYYTDFFYNKLITDIETNGIVKIGELGQMFNFHARKAYSHTAQVEATMEVLRGWTMTLAYRYTDSRETVFSPTHGGYVVRERPLQNRWKGIISTSYQTPLKKWQFDLTAQFNGPGRMPEEFIVPAGSTQYYTRTITELLYDNSTQLPGSPVTTTLTYHRWYPQLMAQITKYWRTCSLYVGGENITNFTQKSPIIGASAPFDTSLYAFDASQIWAPINGWKVYLGFRWNLAS